MVWSWGHSFQFEEQDDRCHFDHHADHADKGIDSNGGISNQLWRVQIMIVIKTAGEDEEILNYARKEIENCGCKEMQEILKEVQ